MASLAPRRDLGASGGHIAPEVRDAVLDPLAQAGALTRVGVGAVAIRPDRHIAGGVGITLPLIRPFINIAVVMNTIYVFNSFPIIWVTTQGGPANSTDILVTYLYKLGFRLGKLGEASALSIMMFVLLLGFTILYVRLAMRSSRT